jgi:hypothetical protein
MNDEQDTIEQLLAKCRRDQHGWLNGNTSVYALPEEGTMMPALGGVMAGGPRLAELQRLGAGLWESGSGDVEFLDGGVTGDLAWLVMVEHAEVKFVHRNGRARWELRVTELFRHNASGWERFHRHADPLVWGHTIDEALDLLT